MEAGRWQKAMESEDGQTQAAKVASSTILKEIGTLKTVQEVRLVFFQAAYLEVFKSNSVLAV